MLGEKWDQSAPKGHNHKFPIWPHHPWTSAWDDDNHLFNSNKQSSVSLQQQAVFQKAAFCSDLIQVVSTAAGQCISKTTCKQTAKRAFFVNPRIPSKQTRGKKAQRHCCAWAGVVLFVGDIKHMQNKMYSEKWGGMAVTKGFGGRINPFTSLSITAKRVMVVKRVDYLVWWCGVFCLDALPVCAYQTHSVLPLCFHFAQFDCQLFLRPYLPNKDPNFPTSPLSFPLPILFILPKSRNFRLPRDDADGYRQRRWILVEGIVVKTWRCTLIKLLWRL